MSDINTRIKEDVTKNRVKLYMKGTPSFPQCGFSMRVVEILANYDTLFDATNVLEDMEIREGIKQYFDWPTIPQLIVDGELVGGCDIITELHQSGELEGVLKGE